MDRESAYRRLLGNPGTVVMLGHLDTGKTTFAIELARRALDAGIPTAIVDADIGQSTIGPPTTVGLKLCTGMNELSPETLRDADGMAFVGSISPRGHLLPLVTGTAKLVEDARAAGCRLIIVDTTSYVSGIYGQLLKYHKLEVVRPDYVVGIERGGELDPVIGIAKRFTPAEVIELEVDTSTTPRSIEERMVYRERQFAAYFANGVSRWRVKPTVFMPMLPPEFDLGLLDGLLVGMENGKSACCGIGVLEYDASEDLLRMVSPVTEGVRGLRLGSIRIDIDGRSKGPVDLRELFHTE